MTIKLQQLREIGLPAKIVTLAVVEATAFAAAVPVAWTAGGGRLGLLAAAIAAAACLMGGSMALTAGAVFRDPSQAFVGVLLGMLFGMGFPLAVAVVCQANGGMLARSGVVFYLLYFFPITLTVKTVLSLPKMPARVQLDNGQAD